MPTTPVFTTETCEKWALDFEQQANQLNHPGITAIAVETLGLVANDNTPWVGGYPVWLGLSTGHAVVHVTLVDGGEFYFDNGAVGGADHQFLGNEFPTGNWMYPLSPGIKSSDNTLDVLQSSSFWDNHQFLNSVVDFIGGIGAGFEHGNPAMGDGW